MSLSRRQFLQSAAAAAAIPGLRPLDAWSATAPYELIAGVFKQKVRESGPDTAVWGFNLQVPGPVLRFQQGEDAILLVRNRLP